MEGPLSAKDVALHQLNRSGVTRGHSTYPGTPSADATPRTLIHGLLNAASISKSGLHVPRTRKSRFTKSPPEPPPQKRRKSLRQSLGDKATPRTLIKNFLIEASPKTPLEVPQPVALEVSPGGEREITQQLNRVEDTEPPVASSLINDSIDKVVDSQEIDQPSETASFTTEVDVEGTTDLVNPHEDALEEPEIQTPSPKEAESITTGANTQSNTESSMPMNDEPNTTEDCVRQDDVLRIDSFSEQKKSRWKDLVTPQFPVTKRRVLCEAREVHGSNTHIRTKEIIKRKPPSRTAVSKRKSSGSTNLPSSLVKSIFEHFSTSRVTSETLQTIEKGSSLFFKQLSSDLMAYCQHAGRTTIDIGDVELLMKRQGFITSKQSLYSLIEKYLPLEYRQELIPVAQSGNKILLKKNS